jgi:hypothetical protein
MENHPSKKLVRQYHFKDSIHHIVANNIIASDKYMHTRVIVEYGKEALWKANELLRKTSGPSRVTVQADDSLWPEKIKEKVVQERNARDIVTAWGYGLSNLWLGMRDMYQGELVILGDPSIKPYDFVFINDYYTDMRGPIEVEQVVHHFSHDTGFITTIKPDLACYMNTIMSQGATLLASAHHDSVMEFLTRIRSMTGFFANLSDLPLRTAFFLTQLNRNRREPLNFTPLLYSGRPYIAGIQGFERNTLYEAVKGRIYRWVKGHEDTMEFISNAFETWGATWGSRYKRGGWRQRKE